MTMSEYLDNVKKNSQEKISTNNDINFIID